MTKEREVLKLALEALELSHPRFGIGTAIYIKAMNAIKEALAQLEPWEKFCDSNCVWTDHHPDCKLAEQKPVAFEEWLSNQHGDPEEIGFLQALRIAYISGQDSITTPPQRKPLTDEEIRLQWSEFWETECHPWAIEFARAIEAAHGIKGEA